MREKGYSIRLTPPRLATNIESTPTPYTVNTSPKRAVEGRTLSISSGFATRSTRSACCACSKGTARAVMSTVPLFTPVTVAYPPPSFWIIAVLELPVVNANWTFVMGWVSAPDTRNASAYTDMSCPRRTMPEGAVSLTVT